MISGNVSPTHSISASMMLSSGSVVVVSVVVAGVRVEAPLVVVVEEMVVVLVVAVVVVLAFVKEVNSVEFSSSEESVSMTSSIVTIVTIVGAEISIASPSNTSDSEEFVSWTR